MFGQGEGWLCFCFWVQVLGLAAGWGSWQTPQAAADPTGDGERGMQRSKAKELDVIRFFIL